MRVTANEIEHLKDKIIEASFHLFVEKGYSATNMDDIATKLNITRTPLYYHFKNKKLLFESVIDFVMSQYIRQVEKIFFARKTDIFEKLTQDLLNGHSSQYSMYSLYPDIIRLSKENSKVYDNVLEHEQTIMKIKHEAIEEAVKKGVLNRETDIREFLYDYHIYFLGISLAPTLGNQVSKTIYLNSIKRYIAAVKKQYGKV